MNATPQLVSVIIPSYNRCALLLEALESVTAQTYNRIEIIVVDDGSTDGTASALAERNLQYIPLEHTGLPGLLRNRGIDASSGSLIAFLDSDDLWKPEKIADQVAFFERNPDILLCHTAETWLRNKKIVSQKKQKHRRSGFIFEDALKKCIISPSSVMIRRHLFSCMAMFREDLEIAEDYEFWLRFTAEYPVGYLDKSLVVKRGGHADQLSQKYGHIELFRIRALQTNLSEQRFSGQKYTLAVSELIRKCKIYAMGCQKRGKLAEATHYFSLACEHRKYLAALRRRTSKDKTGKTTDKNSK